MGMKIIIETPEKDEEDKIIISMHKLNENVLKLISALKMQQDTLIGYKEEQMYRIHPDEVYYFETVDNKSYMYCRESVYEIKQKLYQIEEVYGVSDFLRISKSVIINMDKISSIRPAFGGRFEAMLENGEKIIISRQYVPELKKKMNV